MAKIIKKKFFPIELPIIGEKYEAYLGSLEEADGKSVKMDMTRKLRGKSLDMDFKIKVAEGKAVGYPKKITLMPFFI